MRALQLPEVADVGPLEPGVLLEPGDQVVEGLVLRGGGAAAPGLVGVLHVDRVLVDPCLVLVAPLCNRPPAMLMGRW